MSSTHEQSAVRRVRKPTAAIAAIALATQLSGCTGGSEAVKPSKAETTSVPASPAPTVASSPRAPHKVAKAPIGAQREAGLDILGPLDSIEPSENSGNLVIGAYKDSRKIQNPRIRRLVIRAIDSSVASAVALQDDVYFEKSDVRAAESMVGQIRDEKLRSQADDALDLVEAQNALNESSDRTPFVSYLLSNVEDPSLRKRASAALGTEKETDVWAALDDQSTTVWNRLDDVATADWGKVYDGSYSQADEINHEVQAYRQTLQRDNQ
jgi:hypothetical protein